MKKITIVIMIIILLIIIITISGIYILSQFEKYTGSIISIENDIISIQSLDTNLHENDINIYEEMKSKYYFSINGITVKGNNGEKIETSKLKVGDVIEVYKIKERIEEDIAYSIKPLKNIKIIKVIEKN